MSMVLLSSLLAAPLVTLGFCLFVLFVCQQYLGLLLINARTLHTQENL